MIKTFRKGIPRIDFISSSIHHKLRTMESGKKLVNAGADPEFGKRGGTFLKNS